MKKSDVSPELKALAETFKPVALYVWRGLPALKGESPAPKRDDIEKAFHAAGITAPSAEEYLAMWPQIVESVRRFREQSPDEWALYQEYLFRAAVHRPQWGATGIREMLSERYNMSEFKVREIVKKTPLAIARLISLSGANQS